MCDVRSEDAGPSPHRDGLFRAAAVRWIRASEDGSVVRVHELFEFDAARRILRELEDSCPGLREFVDYAAGVAVLAANLQVGEPIGVPDAITGRHRRELEDRLQELSARKACIRTDDPDRVLEAYARLADAAGILELEREEG